MLGIFLRNAFTHGVSRFRWTLAYGLLFVWLVAHAKAEMPVWGVNSLTLKPAFTNAPSLAEMLTNGDHAVSLERFYQAGGIGMAGAGTDCRVACDTNGLIVVFRCAEPDMSFPATNRNDNWYSQLDTPWDQDSSFPNKVELFLRPDMGKSFYYQFAVTSAGLKFGCERGAGADPAFAEEGGNGRGQDRTRKVDAFTAAVSAGTNEWTVFMRIPWTAIGGKPRDYFGLLPVRTRWRDGEVSSPVAFDFIERPPMDLFIETHFSGTNPVQDAQSSLCRLPSGTFRWQRSAMLTYPDRATVQSIWGMERSLTQSTTAKNFVERLRLTQRWTDLMALEGFNFRLGRGSLVIDDLSPFEIRRRVNAALQKGDAESAWRLLDGYLHQLDFVSRKWFADGSPGDIDKWIPISRIDGFEADGNAFSMECVAGSHSVNLHLELPESGGVRLCGDDDGFFKPAKLPSNIVPSMESFSIATSDGNIVIGQDPFELSFYDTAGNLVTRIGPNDLSFRFGPNGRISAVDLKSSLETNEVIFGFGERYDRFNQNGNVLTLWGMDDWFGNTVGLMNETYKPIAMFHSSKGYTVFDNSTYRLRADVGSTDPHQFRLTQQGPIFDYYFWIGPPERAIKSYTTLTGRPILPPKWAFEPWMGRTGRGWNATSHNPVAEEEAVTKRFASLDIPHSAIYAEGSSCESPDLNQFMAARNIKVLSWFMPVISEPDQARLLPEIATNKLPLLNAGNIRASRELGYVDFTNPNAMELFRRWWRRRLNVGVAGSMVDFGDRVPEEAVFHDGRRGYEMHNFYAYDYHRTCNEVFSEKRTNDFILFGRAAAPGDQRWAAQFAGDHPANFAGLQSMLTGALDLCACGFSTWGSDLGGFMGWPEPAVYMRWTQFACFSPLMRCHGRTPREPWNYGDAAVTNYKFCAWVRENLLDYNYNAAAEAHETGVPIMRSLAVAYPEALSAAANSAEYMFGPDMLVAPVVTEDNNKTITFPPGIWTDLWNGRTVRGPAILTTNVSLDTIPVYLRPGAMVPVSLNHDLEFGHSMSGGGVKALIVTPPDKDEQAAFNYEATPLSPEPARHTPDAGVKLHAEKNGFTVTLNHFGTDYLLVCGVESVSSVKVNNERLSEVTGNARGFNQSGWKLDPTENRAIIRLLSKEMTNEIGITF